MAMVLKLSLRRNDRFCATKLCEKSRLSLTIGIAAALCLLFAAAPDAYGDELVYKPINPSFGGNPFNGTYLLGSAGAQRQFNAPERKRPTSEQFADQIQGALLGQIARQISDQILGENARDSGTFSVGDTQVNFHRENGQVIIDVTDQSTGGTTTIQMPTPTY